MNTNDLETGKYSSKISKKASKIEKTAKSRKIRRLVFLCIILLTCLCGIIIGVSSKSQSIETQYKNYVDAPDMSALNHELLSYKDVFDLFEATFLGNRACQSLMGGFFYDGADYSIYPNETGDRMILHSEESEVTLCDGLASDINVADGIVYYRKLNSRVISTYSISDKKTSKLPLKNVGQFIICDGKIYYIDLSSSTLKLFDIVTAESEEIIQASVASFVVIGNNILFLRDDHTLNEINLSDRTQTVIAKNISAFSYNGELWIQNNEKVYTMPLDKKSLKECAFDTQCNRLLGATKINVYFESADGIYVCNTETGISQKVDKGTFAGASDNKILVYNSLDRNYYVISLAELNSHTTESNYMEAFNSEANNEEKNHKSNLEWIPLDNTPNDNEFVYYKIELEGEDKNKHYLLKIDMDNSIVSGKWDYYYNEWHSLEGGRISGFILGNHEITWSNSEKTSGKFSISSSSYVFQITDDTLIVSSIENDSHNLAGKYAQAHAE